MSTTMIDTIGQDAHNIPPSSPKVAGYVSGNFAWTADDWNRFTHAGKVRIDQSPGLSFPLSSDAADIEYGAGTPSLALGWWRYRVTHGKEGGTFYINEANLSNLVNVLAPGVDFAHTWFWIANWNLNQQEAEAQIGIRNVNGHNIQIVAVQWASPTSNPDTILPGSTLTLREANCDLSETLDSWFPYREPPLPMTGLLVLPNLTAKTVHSSDGISWS